MIEIIYFLSAFLLLTTSSSIYFYRQYIKYKNQAERPQSVELREFIGDLMTGGAIVHVKCINPENLILRSPRNG